MSGTQRLLVASHNAGKARELRRLVARLRFEETGASYEENARGKAEHYARLARLPTLADDSGLEVEALGGRPGIHSARHGGPGLDDAGRCRLILESLAGLPDPKRAARFVAVAALTPPPKGAGETHLVRATCEGRIATEARGPHGFGYDPIFFYPPFGLTFGEIDEARKDSVSHRGLALAKVVDFLQSAEGLNFLTI